MVDLAHSWEFPTSTHVGYNDGSRSEKLTLTPSSSLILAFGLSSRSYGLLRWLRTSRRCLSSTGLSRTISGSTTDHRCASDAIDAMEGAPGVCDMEAPEVDIGSRFGASYRCGHTWYAKDNTKIHTGSLNMIGKSNRGRSMYKNKLSDFSVSACVDQPYNLSVFFT